MSDDTNSALVIHNGSYMIQAGLAGNDAPSVVYPNIIGRTKQGIGNKYYVGYEAINKRPPIKFNKPIENGLIKDWDDMEKIWNWTFHNELRVTPNEHCVLLTESSNNTKENREKTFEIMFESFNIPSLYMENSALLSLYSYGLNTGIVLECGHQISHAVPIFNGNIETDSITTLPFGGYQIEIHLSQLLNEIGYSFTTTPEPRKIIRDIKEKLGVLSLDYDNQMNTTTTTTTTTSSIGKSYELPDGQIINIGNERYTCAESLFQPSLMPVDSIGIHEAIYSSIMKCDINKRFQLYGSVFLSGGTTLFTGLSDRLKKELTQLAPSNVKIKVISPLERKYSVWIGGSILSSLGSFQYKWISRQDYDETGPSISQSGRKNIY